MNHFNSVIGEHQMDLNYFDLDCVHGPVAASFDSWKNGKRFIGFDRNAANSDLFEATDSRPTPASVVSRLRVREHCRFCQQKTRPCTQCSCTLNGVRPLDDTSAIYRRVAV